MSVVSSLARIASLGRAAFGATFLAAPTQLGSRWIGEPAQDPRVGTLLRAVGARDIALGLGAARALARGEDATGWLLAGATCDAMDFAATYAARDELPDATVKATLVLAGGAAIFFAAAAAMGSVPSAPKP